MPTLDLENLQAYRYQQQSTPVGSPPQTAPPQTCCPSTFNLAVEQGVTLSSEIEIQIQDANGVLQPVNVTGNKFEFTAKTDPALPDNDPSVVQIDWQETNTPTQGITWLVIPAATTQSMKPLVYSYQIRMVSPSMVVTGLATGTLTIVQPISSRF